MMRAACVKFFASGSLYHAFPLLVSRTNFRSNFATTASIIPSLRPTAAGAPNIEPCRRGKPDASDAGIRKDRHLAQLHKTKPVGMRKNTAFGVRFRSR